MKSDCFTLPHSSSAIELSEYDSDSKCDFEGKKASRKRLKGDIKRLTKLHDIFAAQQQRALLIVLQGMDAAGKDGIVKHVMSGVNPQGVNVYSFRKPTEEEVRHDYLWRESKVLPERGRIAIFNRSYYQKAAQCSSHTASPTVGWW